MRSTGEFIVTVVALALIAFATGAWTGETITTARVCEALVQQQVNVVTGAFDYVTVYKPKMGKTMLLWQSEYHPPVEPKYHPPVEPAAPIVFNYKPEGTGYWVYITVSTNGLDSTNGLEFVFPSSSTLTSIDCQAVTPVPGAL